MAVYIYIHIYIYCVFMLFDFPTSRGNLPSGFVTRPALVRARTASLASTFQKVIRQSKEYKTM